MTWHDLARAELLRRRADVAGFVVLAGALGVATAGLNAWERLLVEVGVVTAWSLIHAIRGVPEDRPAPRPGPGLAVTAGVTIVLLAVGCVTAPATWTADWLAARTVLASWALVLAAAAESAAQRFGPTGAALAAVSLPATACLLAPVLGSPIFPIGTGISLLASPVVAAGRALEIEVAIRPPLYELSTLGVMEFRYPPWPLHAALALLLALGFFRRAWLRSMYRCV